VKHHDVLNAIIQNIDKDLLIKKYNKTAEDVLNTHLPPLLCYIRADTSNAAFRISCSQTGPCYSNEALA